MLSFLILTFCQNAQTSLSPVHFFFFLSEINWDSRYVFFEVTANMVWYDMAWHGIAGHNDMATYRMYKPKGKKDQYLTEFPYLSFQRLLVLSGASQALKNTNVQSFRTWEIIRILWAFPAAHSYSKMRRHQVNLIILLERVLKGKRATELCLQIQANNYNLVQVWFVFIHNHGCRNKPLFFFSTRTA